MIISPIKSPLIQKLDNIFEIVKKIKKLSLRDNDILAISSKIIALSQGRLAKAKDFQKILEKEAEYIFNKDKYALTIKNGILIPNAGIDHSNVKKGMLILWPEKIQNFLDNLRSKLKRYFKLKNLGLMAVDSHCQPLRRGVAGIALAYSGLIGIEDLRRQKDLFENTLEVTQRNIADMLASAACYVMNESNQRTPLALIRNSGVRFTDKRQNSTLIMRVKPKDCLFKKLYPNRIIINN